MANEFVARNGVIALNNSTVTGSLIVTNGITGSLFGSASYAITSSRAISASYAPLVNSTKINQALTSSFTGNPKKATITFTSSFADTGYSVIVTGHDLRSWTIENKATTGFVINSNSNVNLSGSAYWIASEYGEA
jgi:hypothetical protein